MNVNDPLVSVLMTAYNRAKYIGEAIESVLDSAYTNWELIITDDCSTDNTLQIAQQYAEKDRRVRVYKNEKNLGDYPNRNKAASLAKGTYLKYLDADDTIYKYTLNYMVEAMLRFPEAAMAISFNLVDDMKPYPQVSTSKETYHAEYLGKGILGCGPSASIIRKDIFESIGGFSGKQYVGDHELWLKISAAYSIVKLAPSLIWWRQHPEQQIVQERKDLNIQNIRYHHSYQTLLESKHFFNEETFNAAIKRIKKQYARNILKKLLSEKKPTSFIKLWKMSELSIIELLSGFNSSL